MDDSVRDGVSTSSESSTSSDSTDEEDEERWMAEMESGLKRSATRKTSLSKKSGFTVHQSSKRVLANSSGNTLNQRTSRKATSDRPSVVLVENLKRKLAAEAKSESHEILRTLATKTPQRTDSSKSNLLKRNSVAVEVNVLENHSSNIDVRLGRSFVNMSQAGAEGLTPLLPLKSGVLDKKDGSTLQAGNTKQELLRNLLHGSPSPMGSTVSIAAQAKTGALPELHDGWKGPPNEKGCVVTRTRGRREVLLYGAGDVYIFDKIAMWKQQYPMRSMDDAWDSFVLESLGRTKKLDALLKLQYGVQRYDYILKFHSGIVKDEMVRRSFEKKLLKKGMVVERETSLEEPKESFVKILTPFIALCHEAQLMKLMLPLDHVDEMIQEDDININDGHEKVEERKAKVSPWVQVLHQFCNPLYDDKMDISRQAAVFQRKRLSTFKGGDAAKSSALEVQLKFFRDSHRSLLTYSLISKIEIKVKNSGSGKSMRKEGIGQLLEQNIYFAMFHLHDDEFPFPGREASLRAFLRKNWVQVYFAFQPLDEVSAYFGEKVALYFAFIGFYNRWLILAALAGIVVMLYGLKEANSGPVFTWTKVFDNALSPWFSLFISTWVTVLPSVWKRQTNMLAWRWFTTDFEQIEVKRPQFQATETRRNPVTGKQEVFFPMRKRITRQTISWIFVAICMFTCVALNGAEVLGGIMLSRPLESETAMAAVICGLGLAGIMFFKNPSRYFAHFLNEWENYRTESNYDDAIILKTYALDFINYYSLLFYFSIVKPNLHYHGLWAFPDVKKGCYVVTSDGYDESQCQGLLIISIFILFIGGQILERFEELVIPWLINKSAEIITAVRLQYRWKRMIKERHRRESHVFRGADSFVRSPTPLPMPHIDAVIHSNHPPPQPATAGFGDGHNPVKMPIPCVSEPERAAAIAVPTLQIVISGSRESGLLQSAHTIVDQNQQPSASINNLTPNTPGSASLGTSVPSLDISEAPIVNKAGSNLKLSQNSFGSVGVRRALSVGSADPSRYTSSGHIATRNQLKSISFKSSNSTSSGKATPKQSTANASAAYLNPSSAPPAEPAQPSPQQLMELAFFSLSSMSTDDYVEQIRGGSVNATSRRMSIDVQGFRGAAQSNSANANRAKLSKIRLPQFYRDDKLVPFSGIRDEFSQKIIQLGYIAMFSCSFPLAPCFALLNNVYEVRTDAFKLLTIYQRPLPTRAKDIGIWSNILKFVANASVLTNSAIIAFNSPSFELLFLDGFDDTGSRFAARFTFIIAFHYCVHLLVTAFLLIVPEMPKSVHLAMERAAYLDRLRRGNEVEEEEERLSVSSLEMLRKD